MEAKKILLGVKEEGSDVVPEFRVYDGFIEVVNGEDDVKVVGINSMIDGLILDEINTVDHVITMTARDRNIDVHEFTFTPKAGYKRGTKALTEEIRKGKVSVKVTTLDRKPLFTRMRKGIKVTKK
jgi:hypothetical protein